MGAIIARLERHARVADQTAVATELLGAAEFRKETHRRQQEELKVQCERWLKPSDVRQVHLHQVQARLDGTCNWITANDVFDKWAKPESSTSQDRCLVISGTHGCGKSVLASSVVARLKTDKQHTLFFAFSSLDGGRQSSESLIRTLLWQLLQETAEKASVDTIHKLSLNGEPTTSELWEAFGRIALSLTEPVYCIIDGVDECIDYNHTTLATIMQTLEKCPNLRILLLGRPHIFQVYSGNLAFAGIEITSAMLNQDVEAFINNEIAKSEILSLPEFQTTVYDTLRDKSDGMFLWVRLMVDDLRKSSSKSEFTERLKNLPRGLEKAYQLLFLRLSQRLDKYELHLAQNVLALTSTACRPLNFDELRYAHALHCRSLETMAKPLEEYLILQPPQKVLDITGGLISMTDGVLRLIHSSVRDFLIRPENQWDYEPDRAVLGFRVDAPLTHRSFAWLCLDYMSLEKEKRTFLEPDTSQSMQALKDSYPLLEYATLYAFFHLNRSGPPCSTTLAKIESSIKSTQSTLWIEHFGHLLFEDITLQSQMNEFMAWGQGVNEAGLCERFYAIFEGSLKERNDQFRKLGKDPDTFTKTLEMFLGQVIDDESETSSQEQSNETTTSVHSVHENSKPSPDLQTTSFDTKLKSSSNPNDPSATVFQAINLLKGQTSLSLSHQIELWLRLSVSLRKTNIIIDPLKVLFKLILKKASGIHVYVLLAVAEFYQKFDKFQEALEIYTAASRKMDHLDVPLKFKIYGYIGYCYLGLGLTLEALRSYDRAYSGQEIHLGRKHPHTINSLRWMVAIYDSTSEYTEVLRLSDKICAEQEFVPELDLKDSLDLHTRRHKAYRRLGNHDRATHVKNSLQTTLKLCREFCSNNDSVPPALLGHMGDAYKELDEYDAALECYQLALEAYKSKGSKLRKTLYCQYHIACTYANLGRYHEAEELLETVLAKQQSLLGPNHRELCWTKEELDAVRLDIAALDQEEDGDESNEEDRDEDWEEEDMDESDWNQEEDGSGLHGANGDHLDEEELYEDEFNNDDRGRIMG